MAEFPAMPLWTDAYLGDTQHLTLEEHGAYLKLLFIAWRSEGCRLPADDRRLGIMLGISGRKFAKLRPVLVDFFDVEDGFWTQKRLTKEREFVVKTRAKRRASGALGARVKALKHNDSGLASARANGLADGQQVASTHTHTHTHTSKERGKRLQDDWQPSAKHQILADKLGVDCDAEANKFRDHWRAESRPSAVKRSWDAAFNNWLRRSDEYRRANRGQQDQGLVATINTLMAGQKSGD
jgi:uncharacterized protein YdaU (DUF1376 family)